MHHPRQKPPNRQGGFLLVSLIVVLVILSALAMVLGQTAQQHKLVKEADAFVDRLKYIKQQIDAYQADQYNAGIDLLNPLLFPRVLDELSPIYIPTCTAVMNLAGECMVLSQTPWGRDMIYSRLMVSGRFPRGQLEIFLPTATGATANEHQALVSALGKLPGMTYSTARNVFTWQIDRIGDAFPLDQFLKKDGSTPLDSSWDVGNQSILNAKQLTVRTASGKQQRIDGGVVKRYSLLIDGAGHWISPDTFSCPTGLSQDVTVAYNGAISRPNYDYLAVGSNITQSAPKNGGWQISMTYNAKEKNRFDLNDKGTWVQRHRGQVDIIYLCLP